MTPTLRTAFLHALAATLAGGCATPLQQHAQAAAYCEGQKDYACAVEHIDWLLENGGGKGWYMSRAKVRLAAGDRAGAIEDANRAVEHEKSMSTLFMRATILSELDRIRLIGFEDASAAANPPIDVEAAISDLTQCIGLVPASPNETESAMLIYCFYARRDLKKATGQDYASDDATFRRLACDQCNTGKQCLTDSGCSLNMGTPAQQSGAGWSGGAAPPASAGSGDAWYYARSCTSGCSVSDKAGPFGNEEQCNAARSSDPHADLIMQPGNFGTLGSCIRE